MASSAITSSLVHLLLLHLLHAPFTAVALTSEDVEVFPELIVTSHRAPPGNAEEREDEVLACISNNIALTLVQAQLTNAIIEDFKESYVRDKFNMDWVEVDNKISQEWDESSLEVCAVDQTCSTVLPSLPPPTTPPPATDTEATERLTEMSGHILRYMYAYEQMVLDQAVNEDTFEKEMHDAYTEYDKLARSLEVVMNQCGLTYNVSSLAPLHGKMHITTSNTQTNYRGFCTLRQSLLGLDLLLNMFPEESIGTRRMKGDVEEEEEEEERKDSRRRRRVRNSGRGKRNGKNVNREKRRKRRRSYLD